MADPFGKPETLQEVLDFLGAPSQVSVQGQPSLPVTGGGAIGAAEGPTTVGGGGTAPPGEDAPPGGGGNASNRPIAAGSGWWNEIARWINPAQKFVNVATRLARTPPKQPGAPQPETTEIAPVEPTPTAPTTDVVPPPTDVIDPGELPQGPPPPEPVPPPGETPIPPPEGESPQGIVPSEPPVAAAPSTGTATGDPIPDEVVAMFGGDRPAVEAAFASGRESITPDMIASMADSGQLANFGVTSSGQLTPELIGSIQTGIAVAGLVVAGLSAAGVIDKEASMMLGMMLTFAGGAMAAATLLAGGTGVAAISGVIAAMPALTAVTTTVSVAGMVLAPLIAWGMSELAETMKPNLKIPARQYGAESYEVTTTNANTFNALVDIIRDKGITDPTVLNQVMLFGEQVMLPFYLSETTIKDAGSAGRVRSGPTGPLWQAAELEQAGNPEAWAPHRLAAQNLAALDTMLGSKYAGLPQWYAAQWRGLDPNTIPQAGTPEFTARFGEEPRKIWIESGEGGAGSWAYADPAEGSAWLAKTGSLAPDARWLPRDYAWWAQQYPDLARAAAGGMDPLDFAIAMWSGQRPSNQFDTGKWVNTMGAVPNWSPQTWDALADAVLAAETGGAPPAPAETAAPEPEPAPLTRRTVPLATGQPQRGGPQGERESEAFRRKK